MRILFPFKGPWTGCQYQTGCGPDGGVETRTVSCVRRPPTAIADRRQSSPPPPPLPSASTVATAASADDAEPDAACDQLTAAVAGKPVSVRPCFQVCDHHRRLYRWTVHQSSSSPSRVSSALAAATVTDTGTGKDDDVDDDDDDDNEGWSPCRPVGDPNSVIFVGDSTPTPPSTACSGGGGGGGASELAAYGVQTRNVTCSTRCDADELAPSAAACEYFEPAPRSSRPCRLPCPQDCIVTDFGPWSSCGVGGTGGGGDMSNCGGGVRNRTRHRTILSAPVNGGRSCPGIVETERCPTAAAAGERCRGGGGGGGGGGGSNAVTTANGGGGTGGNRYRVGRWSDCTALHDGDKRRSQKQFVVLGLRRRTVDCTTSGGRTLDPGRVFDVYYRRLPVATVITTCRVLIKKALLRTVWQIDPSSQFNAHSFPRRHTGGSVRRTTVCSSRQYIDSCKTRLVVDAQDYSTQNSETTWKSVEFNIIVTLPTTNKERPRR